MWEHVDLKGVLVVSNSLFDVLHLYARGVRSLYLNSRNFLKTSHSSVEFLISKFANLELLDISNTNVVTSLECLESLSNLQHLIMDHVSLDLQFAFTKSVPSVKSLETLSYKGNRVLCASTIATVLCALPNCVG